MTTRPYVAAAAWHPPEGPRERSKKKKKKRRTKKAKREKKERTKPAKRAKQGRRGGFRLDPLLLPTIRVAGGATTVSTPGREYAGAFEMGAGLSIVLTEEFAWDQLMLLAQPYAGYSLEGPREDPYHAFFIGGGLGVGTSLARLVYRPRYMIGRRGGEVVRGLRNTAGLELWWCALAVEVGHERRWGPSGEQEGLVVLGSVDLVALYYSAGVLSWLF